MIFFVQSQFLFIYPSVILRLVNLLFLMFAFLSPFPPNYHLSHRPYSVTVGVLSGPLYVLGCVRLDVFPLPPLPPQFPPRCTFLHLSPNYVCPRFSGVYFRFCDDRADAVPSIRPGINCVYHHHYYASDFKKILFSLTGSDQQSGCIMLATVCEGVCESDKSCTIIPILNGTFHIFLFHLPTLGMLFHICLQDWKISKPLHHPETWFHVRVSGLIHITLLSQTAFTQAASSAVL